MTGSRFYHTVEIQSGVCPSVVKISHSEISTCKFGLY